MEVEALFGEELFVMRRVLDLGILGKSFDMVEVGLEDVFFIVLRVIGSHEDEEIKKVFSLVYRLKWNVVLVGILVDLEL